LVNSNSRQHLLVRCYVERLGLKNIDALTTTFTMQRAAVIRILALIALILTVIFLTISFSIPRSPARKYLINFTHWLKHIPETWGTIVLAATYAVSLVFCLPGTPFDLASGFLFGFGIGSLTSVGGCITGASIAFFVGRTLAREWAQSKISQNKKAARVNMAVEANGWLVVFMIRLSPVLPFGLCNYIFGVTKVRFWVYWTATFLGLMPCTIAYTYLGSLMRSVADLFSNNQGSHHTIILVISIVATALGIVVISIVTKRTLDRTIDDVEKKSLLSKSGAINADDDERPLLIAVETDEEDSDDSRTVDSGSSSRDMLV